MNIRFKKYKNSILLKNKIKKNKKPKISFNLIDK